MVGDGVRVGRQDGVVVLTLDRPPSNALTLPMRTALLAALHDAAGYSRGLVLTGAGAVFSSSLPLEPDTAAPCLADLCTAVEAFPAPVVAALGGLALGRGAELALAAHARVAVRTARIALPSVALGLCPEGGTTRRLPALIGAEAALKLLITGRAVGAEEAFGLGLVDAICEAEPIAAALALIGAVAAGRGPARPAPDGRAWSAAVAEARRVHHRALPAVLRTIDCVEAGLLLPPEAALAFEAVAREDLEVSPEVAGLRAAARAERRAATLPPAVARVRPDVPDRIGLAGEAPALGTLAAAALSRGLAVTWVFPTVEAEARATAQLTPLRGEGGRLTAGTEPALLDSIGFLLRDGAAGLLPRLAPRTVVLDLDGAEGMGLSLAPSGRVCELGLVAEEAPDATAVSVATLRRIGVPPVLVGGRPGMGRRLMRAGDRALGWMAGQGVPSRTIELALEALGARRPVAATSFSGRREIGPEEVQDRWLAALANEGFRLLEAGIARRASDIDHVLVAGHFFPRWQGGPMHQADRRGLMVLRADLRRWAAEDAVWRPAPLLDRLIGDGMRLATLDGGA